MLLQLSASCGGPRQPDKYHVPVSPLVVKLAAGLLMSTNGKGSRTIESSLDVAKASQFANKPGGEYNEPLPPVKPGFRESG